MQELGPYTLFDLEEDLKFFPLENVDHIAVACSGGADSLALTLLLSLWAKQERKHLTAFHVDHSLRAASSQEAKQVSAWLANRKITHKILTWEHSDIPSRLQEQARKARYDLLETACKNHGIRHLFLAHHRGDQEETFWMRLLKGSGPEGLSGMKSVTQRGFLTLLRPLLEVEAPRLKAFLMAQDQPWIEDPSNENADYLRIRIREVLKDEGHSFEMLSKTLRRLREDSVYFENLLTTWIDTHVHQDDFGKIHFFHVAFRSLPPAVGKRLLTRLLGSISGAPYPPRGEALETLWNSLVAPEFKALTLSQCLIHKTKDKIIIERELPRRGS